MAECRYCHRKHFKIQKIDDISSPKGYRYQLYDPISEKDHDQNRCREVEAKRLKAKEKKEKESRMIPRITYKKSKYWDTNYFDKPRDDIFGLKRICSCDKEQCFPALLVKPHYFFDTVDLTGVDYIYWCCFCGYYLSQRQIETYFSQELEAISKKW
jgi:hypothetical protein